MNLIPKLCLPPLNIFPMCDFHFNDLVDFINLLIRQKLLHDQSLFSVTILVTVQILDIYWGYISC